MKFDIIYEDDDIVAVNKPSGLLSIPDRYNDTIPCLYHQMAADYEQLFVVHRLDKDTSGLIVFAKNEESHKYMSQLFEGRFVEKYYLAIVNGKPIKEAGTIIAPIAEHPTRKGRMSVQKKGRFAHTDYELKQSWNGFSLLRLRIFTGRTHQIRVHMQHLGTSIVCDPFYGTGGTLLLSSIKKKFKLAENEEEEKPLLKRLALHASELKFTNAKNEPMVIVAPLPKDMSVAIKQLDKWGTK
ncbi:MAG: RluA family pseudouridine synthase [Sphingobacteriales bacterium]|nr:MAG: RluA family pseudouridine synthase [Sphingobacteriales bacterium]